MFRRIGLITALVLFTASSGFAGKDDDGLSAFTKALAIAQTKVPAGAKLLKARLEGTSVTSIYGFYFTYNNRVIEIEVSSDGEVIKQKDSIDDVVSKDVMLMLSRNGGPAKIPQGRLMEIAAKELKNTQFNNMKYEVIDGVLYMVFGNTMINTETGEVRLKKMGTA